MPIYEFECSDPKCGFRGAILVRYDERDEQRCPDCGTVLVRDEIAETAPPNTKGVYEMKGILSTGQQVPGHFGVEAKGRRKRS